MGDRHGGRFARRGRALNPPRPQVDAHRGEGIPTRRSSKRICPAQERSPRRRPLDTAHGRKDWPRAKTLPTAKASRHGARAKGLAPRRNTPRGEGLPTQRTSERICPRRNTPLGEGLPTRRTSERICPHARTRPSAKASRHGARAKRFAPTREHAPRRRPPDTAHGRKDLSRAGTLPTAKAYRHGARAKGFAPRRNAPHGEGLPTRRTGERICPTGGRVHPACRRTAGRSRPTDSRKTPLRRGRTHSARPLPSSFTEKK